MRRGPECVMLMQADWSMLGIDWKAVALYSSEFDRHGDASLKLRSY